jgi:hypothetical protein
MIRIQALPLSLRLWLEERNRMLEIPFSSASECSSAYAKSMPASLPSGLRGIILNAKHNYNWSCSSPSSLRGLLCFGLLSALTLRAHLRCDNFCDAKYVLTPCQEIQNNVIPRQQFPPFCKGGRPALPAGGFWICLKLQK